MYRSKTCFRWFIIFAALGSLLLSSGCGGNGDGEGGGSEVVYLSIFNAYPGSNSLDLYGPAGTITTGLGFGERTDEPIAVDRNLGSDFTLLLDGAPQEFDIQEQLFSLYPQETATFMLTRREDSTAQTKVFRHQQSISPSCRLVPDNSLALTSDPISTYAFILGWNFEGMSEFANHDEQREQDYIDANDIEIPGDIQAERDELFDGIPDHPFFALTPIEDEEGPSGTLSFVWLGPEDRIDPPRVSFEDGSLFTYPNSSEYIDCLAQEVEGQDVDDGDPVVIEEDSDCGQPETYDLTLYEPATDFPGEYIYYYPELLGNSPSDENACSIDLRIYSDFDNIFEGEHGHDGYNENTRVDVSAEFGVSDHFFFSLYGRPAQDPQIEQWTASQIDDGVPGFQDMADYPSNN